MIAGSGLRMILSAALAAALCTACANGKSGKGVTEVTHDGLHLVPHSSMQRAWVKPSEDFSQYTHVMLVDCLVSFKKNWKTRHPGLRAPDMDRFKKKLAEEFREVFTEELHKGGYPIVAKPDEKPTGDDDDDTEEWTDEEWTDAAPEEVDRDDKAGILGRLKRKSE